MSEQETISRLTYLGKWWGQGRVNRVTLGLLLREHLSVSAMTARTSAFRRLERATDGVSSSLRDYEQAALISASQLNAEAMCQMWLTGCATIQGYLLGSGADPAFVNSFRRKILEILCTSEGRLQIDVDVFMIKRGRSHRITTWALGDGRFNADTELATWWQAIWSAEIDMSSGLPLTSATGSEIADLRPPSRPFSKGGGTPISDRIRPTRPGWTT